MGKRFLAWALIAGCLLVGNCQESQTPGFTADPNDHAKAPEVRIYAQDAGHLWNRVHAALLVREYHGTLAGLDLVDPLLWPDTTFLLEGESHARAIRVLDEFLNTHGERLVEDPVKRAVLQHDLWAVFDWLVEADGPTDAIPRLYPERREALRWRVAEVMRRVALRETEIAALPDNYGDAVKSGALGAAYDAENPGRGFLPADLLATNGDWVLVRAERDPGRRDLAPVHTTITGGRSVFLILFRLPGGRKSTEAYLEKLRDFPEPWMKNGAYAQFPYSQPTMAPNPALPQLPMGSAVALVRRMMVIDDKGMVRATALVEEVQIREFHSDPAKVQFGDASAQDAYDVVMRRAGLFVGHNGGLEMSSNEPFARIFDVAGQYPLDRLQNVNAPIQGVTPVATSDTRALSCFNCHAGAGIFSVNSYVQGLRKPLLNPPRMMPQVDASSVGNDAVVNKMRRYEMGVWAGMDGTASDRSANTH